MASMSQSNSLEQQQLPQSSGLQRFLTNAQWICRSSPANKKKSPNYPCKRWGHSAVIHDKYMYVFGGFGKSDNSKQWEQIFRLDCMNFTWERVNNVSLDHPVGRDSHTCVKLRNKLYIFGGSQETIIYNELWGFDLDSQQWNQVEVDVALSPREGHTAIALSDRLMYIYGGWHSTTLELYNDHWLYDEDTRTFIRIAIINGDEIPKRESHSAVLLGDQVYIFGGQGQNVGKTCTFYKDIFQLSFPPLNQIYHTFDEIAIIKSTGTGNITHHQLSINVEKLKSNSYQVPSARASHTAIGYLDRFMFVIGGEGYKSDLSKDNDCDNFQVEDDSNEDEENKPVFPKNDIWIFENLMKTWTKIQMRQKIPAFLARCSHSCVIFKDQLIVFGGLKSTRDVLEDMMILHLKDSENHLQALKKEEMKNICKYCQMIYGSSFNKDDDECYPKIITEQLVPQNKVTISFIQGIVKLIQWPFTCFALLVDNAYIQDAKFLRINMLIKKRIMIFNQKSNEQIQNEESVKSSFNLPSVQVIEIEAEFSSDAPQPFTYTEFVQTLHNFDCGVMRLGQTKKDRENIIKNGVSAQEMIHLEQVRVEKKTYSNNLKLACLRLGQTLLLINKHKNNFQIGLVSTNKFINPNIEDLIVFHYQVVDASSKKTYNDELQRNLLLKSIQHLYSEEDILIMHPYNYTKIIIFDLNKLPIQQDSDSYEVQIQGDDIINTNYKAYGSVNTKLLNQPDYSLKQYLKIHYLEYDPSFQIYLNNQTIVSGLLSHISNNDRKSQIDTTLVLPKNSNMRDVYDKFGLYQFQESSSDYGILIYNSEGRLINRVPKPFGSLKTIDYKFDMNGYIQVKEFMVPNLIQNGFECEFLSKILFQGLKKILKKGITKQIVIEILQDQEELEPPIRKEIKID